MIPLLVITASADVAEPYIKKVLGENNIEPYAVHRLYKTLSTVTIEQIRGLSMLLSRSSHPQAAIVYDFDTAKKEAQNAFLKTLEEESNRHVLILIASHEHLVLPTVRSRCRIKKIVSSLIQGDINSSILKSSRDELIKLISQSVKIDKDRVLAIIDSTFYEINRLIISEDSSKYPGISNFYKELIDTKRLLISNNLNPEYSLDHLMIMLLKTNGFSN